MTVRDQMGTKQFIFVEISGNKYRFTHSTKWNVMRDKWKPHLKYFRGRQHAVLLTHEHPTDSKSGSTFEIKGVFAICANHEELSYLNQNYWTTLKFKETEEQKLQATRDFSVWLMDVYDTHLRTKDYYKTTLEHL